MVYVITAVHNRYHLTEEFVERLLRQTYKDIKLVLVDDGSTDGTAEMVKERFPNSIILTGNGNLWWGGSLHKAYELLSQNSFPECDYILYMNDDASIDEHFVERGIEYLNIHKDCLITACGYSKNNNRLIDGPVFYDIKTGEVNRLLPNQEGNCASTRALFMSFDVYKRTGGFHPVLLPHYASDYEYTMRACRKNRTKVISFDDLKYYFDEKTTGDNDIKRLNIKKLFGKRSRYNPIYRMNFVFLVTPAKYWISNVLHGVERFVKKVLK